MKIHQARVIRGAKVKKRCLIITAAIAGMFTLWAVESSCADRSYATRISRSNLKKQGQFTCGRINNLWQPVRRVAGNMYVPYATEYLKLQASAPTVAAVVRRKYRARLSALHEFVPQAMRSCNTLNRRKARLETFLPIFELKDKIGVALVSSSDSPSDTGIYAIDPNGSLSAIASSADYCFSLGSGNYLKIGPNGNIFVSNLWRWTTNPDDSPLVAQNCGLVEIDKKSGVSACVTENYTGTWSRPSENRNIQFDQAGWVYTATGEGAILKSFNGVTTTVYETPRRTNSATPGTYITDWLALSSGDVLISLNYVTRNDGEEAVIRSRLDLAENSGEVSTLLSSTSLSGLSLMTPLPDGRVLIGAQSASGGTLPSEFSGIVMFNPQTRKIETTPYEWNDGRAGASGYPTPLHSLRQLCGFSLNGEALRPEIRAHSSFCSSAGNGIQSFITTKSGGVFAMTADLYSRFTHEKPAQIYRDSLLVEFSPEYDVHTSATWIVYSMIVAGDSIVLHGVDQNNKWVTTVYDSVSKEERVLISGDSEVQIFQMGFSQIDGQVRFDGITLNDGNHVFGSLDIKSGDLKMESPSIESPSIASPAMSPQFRLSEMLLF